MTRLLGIVLAGSCVLALPEQAMAEGPATDAPLVGSRVRLFTASAGATPVVGTLAGVDDESLVVTVDSRQDPLVLSRRDLVRLERSVRPSRKRRGALIGAGVGLVGGIVSVGAATEWEGFVGGDFGPGPYFAIGAVVALFTAGIGAAVAPGERWAEVPPDRLQIGLRPSLVGSRGLAIVLSWR